MKKEEDFLLKTVSFNLDSYYKLDYKERNKWDELLKFLTTNNYQKMYKFIKDVEMLKYYWKKLYTILNKNKYLYLIINDEIKK